MNQEQRAQIKDIVKILIENIGISARIEEVEDADEVRFVIKLANAGTLIGGNGANLVALNHLVKKIAQTQVFGGERNKNFSFSVDVNDYQKQKNDHLKETAKMQAQRVRYFKKEVLLQPMNAHDRRVVHAALTEYPDITTESIGEDPNRRIMIKPFL